MGLTLVTKYIKKQSYPNVSIIYVGLSFLYTSMKKNKWGHANHQACKVAGLLS